MLARGPARGKAGDDDSGAHCGVRRIQGSKSDYQLVSEARLRCSLAFRATFYFRWLDNDPAFQAHAAPEGPSALLPKPPHPETTQHTTAKHRMTTAANYMQWRKKCLDPLVKKGTATVLHIKVSFQVLGSTGAYVKIAA